MPLTIGIQAPDFKLFNTDKKEVTLSDFKGKNVVINFFPAAFTSTCTAQLCNSRDEMTFYNNLGVTVLGVSVDMPFSLGAYKAHHSLNYDLLSDFNKDMIKAYDMVQENFAMGMKGVARRGAVLIDKEGIIRYVEATAHPGEQINFEALKEAASKLV
jgi:peroxiredoxin